MSDIKISKLTNVKPVTNGMIIPMSYMPADGNTYKSGMILSEDVKSFVLDGLNNTYATIDFVGNEITKALTGNSGSDIEDGLFATKSYVVAENQKLSNRIQTLEDIDHGVYALKTDISSVQGLINAEVERASAAEATALSDAKKYTDEKVAGIDTFATKQEVTDVINPVSVKADANEAAIAVLNGSGDGSVSKQVADAIANVVASAPEDFDTLKEVADWIAADPTRASELTNKISANETAINNEVSRATQAEAKVLSDAKDYTDQQIAAIPEVSFDGYATEEWVENKKYLTEHQSLADYVTYSYVDNKVSTINETIASNKSLADTAIQQLEAKDAEIVNSISALDTAYKAADQSLENRVKAVEDASITHATTEALNTHVNNGVIHVTADDKLKWNASATAAALEAAVNRIAALEAKLALYDARFGFNEQVAAGGDWDVNFLVID